MKAITSSASVNTTVSSVKARLSNCLFILGFASFKSLLVLLMTILVTCEKRNNDNVSQVEFPIDATGLPAPKFSIPFNEVLSNLKETYGAQEVEIARPYKFRSGIVDYWLKVHLINPRIQRDQENAFIFFAENVAKSTYSRLENRHEFSQIEISVTQEAGKVIALSSNMSKVLFRDSLKFK